MKKLYFMLFLACCIFSTATGANGLAIPLPKGAKNVFADLLCTELKKGTTQKKIDQISDPLFKQMAQDMLNANYSNEFRIQHYGAYPTVETTAAELKISNCQQLRKLPIFRKIISTGLDATNPSIRFFILYR